MSQPQIPTLDIQRFDTDRDAFVAELGAAYREWGFAGIRNHGIPQALIDDAYRVFSAFFALPEDVKRQYHVAGGGGARGYTPFGVETAKGAKYSDLKEFWHIGREIPADSKYRDVMPPNLWPTEVPGFRETGYALYEALDQLGSRVLSALALHIGLPADYFVDKTDSGNSILRPIHYPPITADDIPNVRAGAHEDINLITLLVGASAAGLEVLSRKGEWVPFTAAEVLAVQASVDHIAHSPSVAASSHKPHAASKSEAVNALVLACRLPLVACGCVTAICAPADTTRTTA